MSILIDTQIEKHHEVIKQIDQYIQSLEESAVKKYQEEYLNFTAEKRDLVLYKLYRYCMGFTGVVFVIAVIYL